MRAFAILLMAALAALVALLVFEPSWLPWGDGKDRRIVIAEICTRVIAEEKRVGFKIRAGVNGSLVFDVGGVTDIAGSKNVEIVSRILDCVEKAFEDEGIIDWYIAKEPLPLGLVAQQWNTGKFTIFLERPNSDDDEITLNNLRFPQFAGPKQTVLAEWCEAFSACARCDPAPNSGGFNQTKSVTISLAKTAPVEKRKMRGTWVNPKDPWELVEADGTRYYFICKGGST